MTSLDDLEWKDPSLCGATVPEALRINAELNAAFDERKWQEAKNDDTLICPGRGKKYPTWPPPSMLPALSDDCGKNSDLGIVQGDNLGHPGGQPGIAPGQFETPFNGSRPVLTRDPSREAEARMVSRAIPLTPFRPEEVQAILEGQRVLEPPRSPVHEQEGPEPSRPGFGSCMVRSFRGLCYDLQNMKHLPGKNPGDKIKHAATRDGRLPYILLGVFGGLAALGFLVLVAVLCSRGGTKANPVYFNQAAWYQQ